MSGATVPTVDQPQLFGHPRGLTTLFLTEVGERYDPVRRGRLITAAKHIRCFEDRGTGE